MQDHFLCHIIRRGVNNAYEISTSPAHQKSLHEDPLYSVINPWDYNEPPQLPPSRVPYYQEIESDLTAETYEIPLTSLPKQDGKGEIDFFC